MTSKVKRELTYLIQLRVRKSQLLAMLSDNVQYWLQGPIEVLLKTGKKIVLNKGGYIQIRS